MSTRTVTCETDGCPAKGRVLQVQDDGTQVICGGCGTTLASQDAAKYEAAGFGVAYGDVQTSGTTGGTA